MNLNLMSFPSVRPIQNPDFYPKVEVGGCSLIIFKDKNTPIIIKYQEIGAEIMRHFSQARFPVFRMNNFCCEFNYTVETLFKQLGILSNKLSESLNGF